MGIIKTVLAVFFVLCSVCFCQTSDQAGTRQRALKNYGSAEVLKVHQGEEVYSFRCDIKEWPAVIGEDVPVRVAGVQFPDIVTEQGGDNKFFERHAIKFLNDYLKGVKKIELENIHRGKDFCLVADVIADSNSVAEVLIEKGFAKKLEKTRSIIKPDIKTVAEVKIPKEENITWVAASTSKVFHKSTCSSVKRMNQDKMIQFPTREKAVETGRRPCKTCNP